MTLNELFAHSVCISDNTERQEIMRRSFAFANLPMPPVIRGIRIAAVRGDPRKYHHRGNFCPPCCTAAHLQCINMAEFRGWPFICIFEDDAWPRIGCRETLEKEIASMPETGARFLGWCARRDGAFCGTHAYVVFADCYQTVRDAVTCEKLDCLNIDVVFSAHKPLSLATRLTDPCLFTQFNKFPDRLEYYAPYARPGRVSRGSRVPEGFPSYEEIMKND